LTGNVPHEGRRHGGEPDRRSPALVITFGCWRMRKTTSETHRGLPWPAIEPAKRHAPEAEHWSLWKGGAVVTRNRGGDSCAERATLWTFPRGRGTGSGIRASQCCLLSRLQTGDYFGEEISNGLRTTNGRVTERCKVEGARCKEGGNHRETWNLYLNPYLASVSPQLGCGPPGPLS